MKKILLLFTSTVFCACLGAQTIDLSFPRHAEKNLELMLKQGTASELLIKTNLDENGQALIQIPETRKNYAGMLTITIGKGEAQMDFIFNKNENMRLSCEEEYPHGGNVLFENSAENQSLQRWFMGQSILQQKLGYLYYLQELYRKEDSFYGSLETEKKELEKQLSILENEIEESDLYAAEFMRLHKFLSKDIALLVYADSAQMAQTRAYLTDTLNLAALYTSGLWFELLNGSLALYDENTAYHSEFIKDMTKLLNKADDKVYTSLAENLFSICQSMAWNDLEEELAYILINDGRIKEPTGKLKQLMTLFKLSKGSKAPALIVQANNYSLQDSGQPTILVFYETGCGNCENEMQQLRGNYSVLKEKGYEVVSVSADMDMDVFNNTAKLFPWEAKYCDGEGFEGDNFKNYGVIGTPTFYLIDKDGAIQGRYARLVDMNVL